MLSHLSLSLYVYDSIVIYTEKLPSRSSMLAPLALLYSLETTWQPAKVRSPFEQASYYSLYKLFCVLV